jgi:hypothetical protein
LQEEVYIADTGRNRVLLIKLPTDNPEATWNGMKQKLLTADIPGAMNYFSVLAQDDYRAEYNSLGAASLVEIVSQIPAISPIFVEAETAQYRFDQIIDGVTLTFPISFVKENGIWKILAY